MNWILTGTGKFCSPSIGPSEVSGSLHDCKEYCLENGSRILTYYSDNTCRCCTASSEIMRSSDLEAAVYTVEGKFTYIPFSD